MKTEIPFINVRDLVMFPKMTQGLYIGRQPTINAIQLALTKGHKKVLVLTQKQFQVNSPKGLKDMYSVGTICSVEGSVLLQDGTMKAVLTGETLFKADKIIEKDGVQFAIGSNIKNPTKIKNIDKSEKNKILELIVRAKPFATLDEEALWFDKLKEEKNGSQFLETLQVNLNYRKSAFSSPNANKKFKSPPKKKEILLVNSKIKMQQQLLEEANGQQKLELLKNYFKFEIKNFFAEL